jgi:hypothetical protein
VVQTSPDKHKLIGHRPAGGFVRTTNPNWQRHVKTVIAVELSQGIDQALH